MLDYSSLDPGIREVVRLLRSLRFDTTDSGDGYSKPEDERALECHHVFMSVYPEHMVVESRRLADELISKGITVVSQSDSLSSNDGLPYVDVSYDPVEDVALIGLFHVTSEMV